VHTSRPRNALLAVIGGLLMDSSAIIRNKFRRLNPPFGQSAGRRCSRWKPFCATGSAFSMPARLPHGRGSADPMAVPNASLMPTAPRANSISLFC
jgi:hypothetical protein